MPDPDVEVMGGGGGEEVAVSKIFFSALRASIWSKNKGAPSPPSATESDYQSSLKNTKGGSACRVVPLEKEVYKFITMLSWHQRHWITFCYLLSHLLTLITKGKRLNYQTLPFDGNRAINEDQTFYCSNCQSNSLILAIKI